MLFRSREFASGFSGLRSDPSIAFSILQAFVRLRFRNPDRVVRTYVDHLNESFRGLGFDPEDLPVLFGEPKLDVTKWGTVRINHRTMETSLPGVYAAGDIVRGASLVVWAIRDGRDAASSIHRALSQPHSASLKLAS